nr:hypothetical protein CFP56_14312 [Quercus suber]
MASHHPIRKKLQDDPHMLGTKNKEHEDKHNVLMTQKNKVGGSKSELARWYGSKSVVKYPRCSLWRHSTYVDAGLILF